MGVLFWIPNIVFCSLILLFLFNMIKRSYRKNKNDINTQVKDFLNEK